MKNSLEKSQVLYQLLGNTWYAFIEKKGEVYFTPIPRGINPLTDNIELRQIVDQNDFKRSKPGSEQAA